MKSKVIRINVDKIIVGLSRAFKYAFGILALIDLYCVIGGLTHRNWRLLLADSTLYIIIYYLEFNKRCRIFSNK